MRKEIVRILVAHDDPTILRRLSIEISRSYERMGVYAHIATATTYEHVKEIIEQGYIDFSCIYFNWENEDVYGEDLIELIRKNSSGLIIAFMENVAGNNHLKKTYKHYPIMYPTQEMFFADLNEYLKNALLNLKPYSQKIVIKTHTKGISFYLEEVAYIYGHTGKTTVFIYDFETKRYKKIQIPISLTIFLSKYNKLHIMLRCHRDYAVNRMMIRFVHKSREAMCIELTFKGEKKYPVEIPMSESYKKMVLRQMNIEAKGVD